MSLSPTALLGKTEFPPIEAEPFREITVTADSLPPSDTFEMEGHDSYDSTENTVWKRGNDEKRTLDIESNEMNEAFIFCESGAGSEPRIVQNLEKMEPLEALVSPESTPDSKPKVIQTSERSEATIEAVQLSLPKQPATEDLMTEETAVGFVMIIADSEVSGSEYGICDEYIDPWCDPCENDGKYARAVSFCSTCVDFFCKQCNQAHSKFHILTSHEVKHGTAMPSCQPEKPPRYEECRIHFPKRKEYFCIDHSKMVCRECKTDHTGCSVKHATVMSKSLTKSNISYLESEVADAQREASNARYALECNIKSVQRKRKNMLKVAEEEHDKLKTNIGAKLNSVTKEINDICDEEVSSLTSLMNDFTDGTAEYVSALNTIQKETRSKLDTSSFIKLQSLIDNIRRSNIRLHETTLHLKTSDLQFDIDLRWKSLSSSCPGIGTVQKIMSPFSPAVPLREMNFPLIIAEPVNEVTVTADSTKLPIISAAFGIGVQFSTLLYRFTIGFDNAHLHQYAREWLTEDQRPTTMTPMALLIGPDKETLAAFGYEAKKKYKELIQYANHNDFYYFPHFGMDLRKEFRKTNLENLTITDSTGKAIPVKTLLILALKFFQDDFLVMLNKRRQICCVTDISWTIIVPSFWTEAAKQFTMKAVNEAGFLAMHVRIVTEAQAAATFCRSMLKFGGKELGEARVTAGLKYLILDVGEQDSQIIVEKLTPSVVPRLLCIASFEGVSYSLIDDALNTMFADIVGDDVFQRFVKTNPDDWLSSRTSFKTKLINRRTTHDKKVGISISIKLLDLYETMKGKTLKEEIAANSELAADLKIYDSRMYVGSNILRRLFEVPATKIILFLKTFLRTMETKLITTVFMIGELTKISELQNIVQSSFADINIVFPNDPELAVVNGAVIDGFYRMNKHMPS